jgi:HK97 family phage portal protein
MGFLGLGKKVDTRSISLSSPLDTDVLVDLLGSRATKSGATVDPATAMEYSAVHACVKVISESIGSIPFPVYRDLGRGGREKAKEHPLYRVLRVQANPYMTATRYLRRITSDLARTGNTYSYIGRSQERFGDIAALWPLKPHAMKVAWNKERQDIEYRYDDGAVHRVYRRDEIFHIAYGGDGYIGKSPINLAREAIGLGMTLEEYTAYSFSEGVNTKVGIEFPPEIMNRFKGVENPEDAARQWIRAAYKKIVDAFTGRENYHKPVPLEPGMKIHEIPGRSANDAAQLMESRRFQLEEVARIYRIPLHMIGDLTRSTNNNIEHQALEFVTHTLMPWLALIEQDVNAQLIDPRDQGDYFSEFQVEGLLRGDSKSRGEFYKTMFFIGAYSINDILAKENMPLLPDDQDVRVVPVNMQTIEQLKAGSADRTKAGANDDTEGKDETQNV